jgi:glycosyltransferase involved in cell wall biosynthesis
LLRRALESVARQTLQSLESVVIDDGSDADQLALYPSVFEGLGARFRLIEVGKAGERGHGPASARSRGLRAARGRFVAFIDDDDYWTCDDHLRVATEVLDTTGADFYCADMQGFRGNQLVYDTFFPRREQLMRSPRVHEHPAAYLCERSTFVEFAFDMVPHPNVVVLRRELVERAGEFLARLHYAEDLEYALRLADRCERIVFCDQCVARHRLPEGNSSSLNYTVVDQHLQSLAAAQHLRAVAHSPEVRRAARKGESWSLRLLSRALRSQGRYGTAVALAVQAVVVRPTLGGLLEVSERLLPGGSRPRGV